MQQATADRLFTQWVGGEPERAGIEIFGSLTPAQRVARGFAVLQAAANQVVQQTAELRATYHPAAPGLVVRRALRIRRRPDVRRTERR
jgi:hypothetical protein